MAWGVRRYILKGNTSKNWCTYFTITPLNCLAAGWSWENHGSKTMGIWTYDNQLNHLAVMSMNSLLYRPGDSPSHRIGTGRTLNLLLSKYFMLHIIPKQEVIVSISSTFHPEFLVERDSPSSFEARGCAFPILSSVCSSCSLVLDMDIKLNVWIFVIFGYLVMVSLCL